MEGRESLSNGDSENLDSQVKGWGDDIGIVRSNGFRIGVLNVGGLMAEGYGAKMQELRTYFTKLRLDAVGITECNVHWKMLPVQKCLPERTRGWWECLQITTAYYEDYPVVARHQAGGVSLWSINKGAHRVMECGKDPRGLGRWVWTRYRGRSGVNVRFVTAYRPVLNKQKFSQYGISRRLSLKGFGTIDAQGLFSWKTCAGRS